jgi:glycosyltransferase involved in cell wall biosynthesis
MLIRDEVHWSPSQGSLSVNVAINAQLLSRSPSFRSGGISRVIYSLLAELARDPRGLSYDVFAPFAPAAGHPLAAPALRYHPTGGGTVRAPVRIGWEQTILPLNLARLRPALLHATAYAAPLTWPGPAVLTIYDLTFLRYPRAFRRGNRAYLTVVTRLSARRARRIITISEHSRRDIVHRLGIPSERIVVAYPAVDARYQALAPAAVAAFRQQKGLPDTFIFTLGTLEPRKNLAGLLHAYAHLPVPRPPLMVAGGAGWRYSPIFDTVKELGLESDVRFLGFVPEDDLPAWYSAARLFAYPSLYEGFGLPVLEAMACGTPTVTSTASSLPEVAGDAALTVNPTDDSALAEAMQAVLGDPGRQASMRSAGLRQAARFSWRVMADQTVATYLKAMGQDL